MYETLESLLTINGIPFFILILFLLGALVKRALFFIRCLPRLQAVNPVSECGSEFIVLNGDRLTDLLS